MATERGDGLRVSFFGAMTLLAKEIRRQLEDQAFPVRSASLYDMREREGSVTDFAGEAMIVTRAEEALVGAVDLAFVCGESDPRSADYIEWVTRSGGVAIDLAGASRGLRDVPVVNLDVNPEALEGKGRRFAVPHTLAHPLTTIFHRLGSDYTPIQTSVTIFRPVSDLDDLGIEELHRQTVSLLSFSQVPTEVFGRQIAFNLAPLSVVDGSGAALQERIREDFGRVLSDPDPDLGVLVIQAPVFHGHCHSIHVLLEEKPSIEEIESALETPGVVSISRGGAGRTPVDLATETGIWIADIQEDRGRRGAFWIWAVSDAVRSGVALNAARLAVKVAEIVA